MRKIIKNFYCNRKNISRLFSHKVVIVILICSLSWIGCFSGKGVRIDSSDVCVEMENYTLDLTKADASGFLEGWFLNVIGGDYQVVSINKEHINNTFEMSFQIQPLEVSLVKDIPIGQLAREYAQHEIDGMIEYGVNTGMYSLSKEMSFDSLNVEGKDFYRLSYITMGAGRNNYAYLYLHFPGNRKDYIFISLYAEVKDSVGYNKSSKILYKEEFEKILPKIIFHHSNTNTI